MVGPLTVPDPAQSPQLCADDCGQPARADARLAAPAVAAWGAAAIFVDCPAWAGLTTGLLLTAGALAARTRWRSRPAVLVVVLLAAGAAALMAALRVVQVGAGPVPDLAAQEAVVEATVVVTGDPRTVHGGFADTDVVEASVREVIGRGVRTEVRSPVLLLASGGELSHVELGARLHLVGRLAPADDRDLAALVRVERLGAGGDPAWWWTAAEGVRAGVRESVAWAGPAGALVPALVTGDDRALSVEVAEDFRSSGLTHLLAVSGMNLTIVLGALLGLARAVGARGRLLTALAVAGAVGFVLLARPDPSVLRAAAMGLVALAGLTAGDRRRGMRALCVAVLVLILLDPWLARSPGFLLSALATAAILVLAPPWRDALCRWVPRALAEAVVVPLAAQVACAPVVAALSDQVSLVAVAANVLVAPAVAPATVFGLVAGLVSVVSDAIGRLLGALAVAPAWWIVTIGRQCAGLPGADVGWGSSVSALVALTLLCLAAAAGTRWVLRRRWAALGTAVLLTLLVLVPTPTPGWPPTGWVLVACDVGQGDGLVLSAGDDAAVVVDTGPDPETMAGCLDRLDVRSVSAVVLTHLHADHVAGLAGVLGSVPVGEVAVGPGRAPGQAWPDVQRLAAEVGVPVRTVVAGEHARTGTLAWHVLAPPATLPPTALGSADGSAINNTSLVLMVRSAGVRLLLTGDIEPAAQTALARYAVDSGVDLDVDVLKVPHHGSADQDPAFLTSTEPEVAVVSVGAGNGYGHPSDVVLESLADAGAEVVRTDVGGDIAVVVQDGVLAVATR